MEGNGRLAHNANLKEMGYATAILVYVLDINAPLMRPSKAMMVDRNPKICQRAIPYPRLNRPMAAPHHTGKLLHGQPMGAPRARGNGSSGSGVIWRFVYLCRRILSFHRVLPNLLICARS
jgi:hypothetical protein